MASKRKKAVTKKIAVQKPEDAAVPVRYLVLTTNGTTYQLNACTMHLQEAMRGLEKLYVTFQANERAAEQAANAPAPAAAPPAEAPVVEEPSPPAEQVAEKPFGKAPDLHLAKPD